MIIPLAEGIVFTLKNFHCNSSLSKKVTSRMDACVSLARSVTLSSAKRQVITAVKCDWSRFQYSYYYSYCKMQLVNKCKLLQSQLAQTNLKSPRLQKHIDNTILTIPLESWALLKCVVFCISEQPPIKKKGRY